MTYIVEVGITGACLIAVLSPVALWTQFFAPCSGEAGFALASTVNWVASGIIVAVALMGAAWPKGSYNFDEVVDQTYVFFNPAKK